MAGETGSARQEAERLVATVLAMTSKIDDETLSGTADRLFAGLSQVGATLGEFVARATEDPAASRREPAPDAGAGPKPSAGADGGPRSGSAADATARAETARAEIGRASCRERV